MEIGSEGAELLAEKANEFASVAVDIVAETVPEKLAEVKDAFQEFATSVKLPFAV